MTGRKTVLSILLTSFRPHLDTAIGPVTLHTHTSLVFHFFRNRSIRSHSSFCTLIRPDPDIDFIFHLSRT